MDQVEIQNAGRESTIKFPCTGVASLTLIGEEIMMPRDRRRGFQAPKQQQHANTLILLLLLLLLLFLHSSLLSSHTPLSKTFPLPSPSPHPSSISPSRSSPAQNSAGSQTGRAPQSGQTVLSTKVPPPLSLRLLCLRPLCPQ